ncbi:MAG: preprotein translocase subunit YajC [Candidatus Delongbacteria bacterium]
MDTLYFLGMTQQGEGGGGFASMIPFILIIFIIYFLMIRPQSKKAKQHQKMISELVKGDRIVTIGGIFGTVIEVREKTLLIKISNNTEIEILRSSVAEKVNETAAVENQRN